ncbi:MAG: BON domain-containing protein [Pirellulales bacterium]|nr:BON domain-containing protein [Pirellulales bacterium]
MQRLLTGLVVAAIIAVVTAPALAGNQEIAEDIANRLQGSGQMSDFKIGVKYQDGTAWLRGRVSSQAQMETALRLVFQTREVERVVNQLAITSSEGRRSVDAASRGGNPLRSGQSWGGNLAKRLLSAAEQKFEPAQPRPIGGEDPARANLVPTSYSPSAAEPTSAQVPGQLPRQVAAPRPIALMATRQADMAGPAGYGGQPRPMYTAAASRAGVAPARYDQPSMPNYAWPSYAAYPNYAAVTYPKQYSPTAWPYIGPFYPYPQVPLGWRKVTLEWDDGWWFLDFSDQPASCWHR